MYVTEGGGMAERQTGWCRAVELGKDRDLIFSGCFSHDPSGSLAGVLLVRG
jgi:hypothetical protein